MAERWQEYVPSWTQVWAFGRHMGTFAAGQIGGIATTITVLHIATPEQAKILEDSVNNMISSGTTFIESASGLVAVSFAIYSGWKKSTKNMIAAASAVPGVEGIAIDHNATDGAAAAAADSTLPTVKKGVVVAAAGPPATPTALGKEAVLIKEGTLQ